MNPASPHRDLSGPKDRPLSEVLRFKIAELSLCLNHNQNRSSSSSRPSSLQYHLSDLMDGQFNTMTILLLNHLDTASSLSSQPLTAAQICAKTKFHINADCLERLLRYASSLNIIIEVNKDSSPAFLRTALTELIARNPLHQDQASFFCHYNPVFERLKEILLSNEHEERKIKASKDQHNFNGIQKQLRSMKISNIQEYLFPLVTTLVKDARSSIVVDLSGGSGQCMFHLKKYSRNLHCIVFDLPQEVEGYTAAVDVEFIAGDIFNAEQIPQADIFLLQSVLQRHSDQDCLKLLSNINERLNPGGLLINVSQHVPNFGEITEKDGGSLCMDLRLMAMGVSERARIEGDLKMLIKQSGFMVGARHLWNMDYGGRINCMIAYKL